MDTESLSGRAGVHRALGDPSRLAVADALALSDRTPASLAREMGIPSNLMAHHVNTLVEAGVVRRGRSQADRRRVYLSLTDRGRRVLEAGGGGPGELAAPNVVFICTHNSARSQFAEALWRQCSAVPSSSAGTHPAECVHPQAIAAARSRGIDLSGARPSLLDAAGIADSLVVTVCDHADEELHPGVAHLHWSVPDPAGPGTAAAFRQALATISDRIDQLATHLTDRESA